MTRLRGLLPERFAPFTVVMVLVGLVLAFIALYPLSRVLLRAFFVDGRWDLSGLLSLFRERDVAGLLLRTIVVVLASGATAIVVGSMMAWLNERTDARLGFVTDSLPLVPFLLPPIAGAIGWLLLLSPRAGFLNTVVRAGLDKVGIHLSEGPLDIHSWFGMIFVYSLYMIPYVFVMMSAGIRNVDASLEEQSRICGAGRLRTIRKVTIPSIRPSLAGSVLLMTWFGFALFSVPIVIGTRARIEVLSVRIVRLLRFEFPPQTDAAVGLSLVSVFFVAVTWLIMRRVLRQGHFSVVGGKGHSHVRMSLGRWRWPARTFMLLYVVLAAVLPMMALVIVSLHGFWTTNIDWGGLNLDAFRRTVFDTPVTFRALSNSMRLGVFGATLGIVAAGMVAVWVRRSPTKLSTFIDGAIKLPATISTIVLAVGFILAFSGPPFNLHGTFVILLLAYLALYMPQGSVAADAASGQVGQELTEASHVAGAGGGKTFWRISLPLMLPGLMAGWALLFVRMVGDLNASAMLAGTGNMVVGFRILEIFNGGNMAELASIATALTLVSSVVLILVVGISRVISRRYGAEAGRLV